MVTNCGRLETVGIAADGDGLVSRSGTAPIAELADRLGLTGALSAALAGTRERAGGHDPGRVLRDLALTLCDGGCGSLAPPNPGNSSPKRRPCSSPRSQSCVAAPRAVARSAARRAATTLVGASWGVLPKRSSSLGTTVPFSTACRLVVFARASTPTYSLHRLLLSDSQETLKSVNSRVQECGTRLMERATVILARAVHQRSARAPAEPQ